MNIQLVHLRRNLPSGRTLTIQRVRRTLGRRLYHTPDDKVRLADTAFELDFNEAFGSAHFDEGVEFVGTAKDLVIDRITQISRLVSSARKPRLDETKT